MIVAPASAQGVGPSRSGSGSSQHGAAPVAGNSLSGNSIDLPIVGPSRRQMAVGGTIIGLLCASVGAVVAVKSVRVPEFTPVGLVGEPSAVTQQQNTPTAPVPEVAPTPVNPARPNARPTTGTPSRTPTTTTTTTTTTGHAAERTTPGSVAQNGAHTPTTPTTVATPGTDPAPGTDPTPSADPDPPGNAPSEPQGGDAGALPTGALPGDGNIIERGPRNSQGGYHMGDETDATGTMDPSVFSFVYRRYAPQIASCYSTASRAHPVSGVIVMRVRIGTDGHVRSTRVVSDTAHATGLVECIQTSMRAWQYPQPEGGEVEVDYPLRFGGAH